MPTSFLSNSTLGVYSLFLRFLALLDFLIGNAMGRNPLYLSVQHTGSEVANV